MEKQADTKRDLWTMLEEYGHSDYYPMHMPGHKRRGEAVCGSFPWSCDITEIDGFDDLHDPQGVLREIELHAESLWGSERSWLLVNGSTCGILASVCAAVRPGDPVLIARNCHKSVYHGAELLGLQPAYLLPECGSFPFCGSVTPGAVEEALRLHPKARAVILTSPTYEGIVSDIASIAGICHRRGVPLIVDEAHGAHLGFAEGFPKSAVQCGADLVVQSLHKTLPAPTQTALLHLCGRLVDPERVAHQLDIFETSSPSYLLMAMAGACLRFLEREGAERFAAYSRRLRRFEEQCAPLCRLILFRKAALRAAEGFCWDLDPGKLVIGCGKSAPSGPSLAQILREHYHIETEMAQPDFLLAMTSLMDEDAGFDRLAQALLEIDRRCSAPEPLPRPVPPALPEAVLPIREALDAEWEILPWDRSAGRVSAGYVWAYPPGIPWLTPGERIGTGCISAALRAERAGISLKATRAAPLGSVAVLKDAGRA